MARVKPSSLVGDIRGKVGGSVFQGYRGGIFVRSSVSPINKLSTTQLKTRQITSELQDRWRNLSGVERQAWELYTQNVLVHQKNNHLKSVSGHQYYLKCNHYRVQYDFTPFDVPNVGQAINENAIWTASRYGDHLLMFPSRPLDEGTEFFVLFLTQSLSESINNPGSLLRLMRIVTNSTTTYDLTNLYLQEFGRLPEVGEWIHVKSAVASHVSGLLTVWNRQKIQIGFGGGIGSMNIEGTFIVS